MDKKKLSLSSVRRCAECLKTRTKLNFIHKLKLKEMKGKNSRTSMQTIIHRRQTNIEANHRA